MDNYFYIFKVFNKKRKKLVYKTKNRQKVFDRYNMLLNSDPILFPKKFIKNNGKYVALKSEILVFFNGNIITKDNHETEEKIWYFNIKKNISFKKMLNLIIFFEIEQKLRISWINNKIVVEPLYPNGKTMVFRLKTYKDRDRLNMLLVNNLKNKKRLYFTGEMSYEQKKEYTEILSKRFNISKKQFQRKEIF